MSQLPGRSLGDWGREVSLLEGRRDQVVLATTFGMDVHDGKGPIAETLESLDERVRPRAAPLGAHAPRWKVLDVGHMLSA